MLGIYKDIFNIYMSHTIRGKKGLLATKKEVDTNIRKALWVGEQIKAYLLDWEKMDGLPRSNLYIPGEHDEFVQIVYKKKWLSEEQILAADCEIIDQCNMLIAYGDYHSRGMEVEIAHAAKKEIPVYIMPNLSDAVVQHLKNCIIMINSIGDL